jgi:hypothetical protein
MENDWGNPFTWKAPPETEAAHPETVPGVYEYVPFGSEKTIEVEVDVMGVPATETDQLVPLGRPLSVKVTR